MNNKLNFNQPLIKVASPAPSFRKKKVLVWSDSVLATTGFGTVAKHILAALHKTGLYDIDQLAINYFGDFYDKKKIPYTLVPAKLRDPKDPYGNHMFLDALKKNDYDIVFIINDTFVVEGAAPVVQEIRQWKQVNGKPPFSLVYYYPVDCRVMPSASSMIRIADRAVAYTHFAERSSIEAGLEPSDVIYHGTDIHTFKPLSIRERTLCRKKYLGVDNDDTFVFVSVNRNSIRKDIARTILAFNKFKEQVTPNCKLYLHTKISDTTGQGVQIDLSVPIQELGSSVSQDIIFPKNFSAAKGFPTSVLNQLYNCGDAFITTNLGEGWGLTLTEAMAAGVPVVTPSHTSAPEIFGETRGYLVECKEQVYIDNSGYRPWARMEDIIKQMHYAYSDWKSLRDNPGMLHGRRKQIINDASKFVHRFSWENVCQDWVRLFASLKPSHNATSELGGEVL